MKKISLVLTVIVLLFIFAGCEEESGTGSLKIILQQNAPKSITPQSSEERITKYNISGTGPGSKTFSKDSSSKTITIDGLSNGQWKITASGLTNNGNIIATGSKDIVFSGSSSSEVIMMNSDIGNGTLDLNVNWDSNIIHPVLEFHITGLGIEYDEKETFELKEGETSYNAIFKNLHSGSYIVKTVLCSDSIKAFALCEAVRIVNAVTTEGTVSFRHSEETDYDSKTLNIQTSDGYSISGSLSELDSSLPIDSTYTISLMLSASPVSSDTVYTDWYIDGERIQRDAVNSSVKYPFYFKAVKGKHIINCIVSDLQNNICESVTFRYNGITEETRGTAIPVATIRPSNPYKVKLDGSTTVGFLPNNKIAVLSPYSNTLQLCSICENGLLVETNGTYSGTLEDFGFILEANKIITDPQMEYFAVRDADKNLTFLKYNTKKNNISVAIRASDDSQVRFSGTGSHPYDTLQAVTLYPTSDNQGTIIFSGSGTSNIYTVNTAPEGTGKDNTTFKKTGFSDCPVIAAYGDNIIYFSEGNLLFAKFDSHTATSLWYPTPISISGIHKILFINSENILVAGETYTYRFHIVENACAFYLLSQINIETVDMVMTPDHSYMYACSKDGKLYSYATDYVGLFKCLDTYQTEAEFKQVVANNTHVIAVASDGTLHIFEIAEKE